VLCAAVEMAQLDAVEQQVHDYYESNTKRFLRFGQGASENVIHRALWGPGVETQQQAFHYVEDLILEQLKSLAADGAPQLQVVDMGCGAGASLSYLAQRCGFQGLGITLSPVQVQLAQQLWTARKQDSTLRCVQGSFLNIPLTDASADAAYAIEAFLHASSPERFLAEAARILKPGGLLLLCDDFLSERGARTEALSAREQRWLRDFKEGWRVNSVIGVKDLLSRATDFTLARDTDLSPYLQLRRPRDYAIAALVAVARYFPLKSPWWGNLSGGDALQRCLAGDVLTHRLLVLRRR
jgi:cyclopropane fatty-acyl-phospholipid synthase-like methyltransferase